MYFYFVCIRRLKLTSSLFDLFKFHSHCDGCPTPIKLPTWHCPRPMGGRGLSHEAWTQGWLSMDHSEEVLCHSWHPIPRKYFFIDRQNLFNIHGDLAFKEVSCVRSRCTFRIYGLKNRLRFKLEKLRRFFDMTKRIVRFKLVLTSNKGLHCFFQRVCPLTYCSIWTDLQNL